ncbi:MAG TPA: CARDB domain-containing protein [Dehalococcoidia bacterium]|nr:CARDB domain-containing protein [Dehalococcoidia bacterium]
MTPRWLPGPETRAAVVRHPFFLAGLAVVVLLGLTAGVLVVVDSARSAHPGTPTVAVSAITTSTVGPTSLTAIAEGVTGVAIDITTVKAAPGAAGTALGTLAKGDDVVIDGRSKDSGWYRIIFPPLSELHGWIQATAVTVTGDPSTLVVATAEPPVYVEVPTAPPDVLTAAAAPATPTVAATPAVTPTVAGPLPDLVIGTTPTISGGKLFVTVINQGKGDAVGDIVVAVFSEDGKQLLGGATLPHFTLKAGRSIDVGTGYEVTHNQTLLLIVDPNGQIPETDDTNNRATVAISVGNPTPAASAGPPSAGTPAP